MGETSEFYKHNEEASKKRLEYQKRYNKKPDQVKKRVELNRENRRRGTFGDDSGPHAGKDLAHHKNGKFTFESPSKNRGSKTAMPGDVRSRGKLAGKKKK